MPSSDARRRTYRVRSYFWDLSSRGAREECSLAESEIVEAINAERALEAATLTQTPTDVDRLLIDVQRVGVSPADKADDWVPWRIAVMWFPRCGDRADDVREVLAPSVPVSLVAADDAGNLGIAAGLPSYLGWEALEDLTDLLDDLEIGADEPLDVSSSGHEGHVRSERPTLDDLRIEMRRSAPATMSDAFPSAPSRDAREIEPEGPENRDLICDVLLSLSRGGDDSYETLAAELGQPDHVVYQVLRDVERWGLGVPASDEGPSLLLHAGEQFLARGGRVPVETLDFLAGPMDDLNAREAVRVASFILIDEFNHAITANRLQDHARDLVPPAFEEAVGRGLAIRLYAAAVALVARLAQGEAAGCVAEEIVAVQLIELARGVLDMHEDELGDAALAHASQEVASGMFELFQDDDVLALFDMREPGDAALAGHDPINRQLGVADQRVEGWFRPFGWTVPAGHLDEGTPYRWS